MNPNQKNKPGTHPMPSQPEKRQSIQPKGAESLLRKTPAAPAVYRPQPTPHVLQAKKCHVAKRPCGCGGGCGSKSKAHGHGQQIIEPRIPSAVQRSPIVQMAVVIGGKRKNPPRAVMSSKSKGLTKRQQKMLFGSDASVTVGKRRRVCGFGRTPAAGNWNRRLWNGNTRPGWNLIAFAILIPGVNVCAWPGGCVNMATDRDHIVPYRRYIHDNAHLITACDGTCHYLGVSMVEARALANDVTNLRPLCAHHNGVKAAADLADPYNINYPPDVVGECPTGSCRTCPATLCL